MQLFDEFPYLENDYLIIKRMTEEDIDALMEITENEKVYKYIPYFLYKKNRNTLLNAINHISNRDFIKKKYIIAGIYMKSNPSYLIGLAEMFDYKVRSHSITIGYRINEKYWHQNIASTTISMLKDYLSNIPNIQKIYAYVMPENIFSIKALMKNNFIKSPNSVFQQNWAGQAYVETYEYIYNI